MHKIYLSLLLASLTYSQTISFDEALDMTLKNNKDLKNQKLQIENSKLDIKSVDSFSYGKLALSEEISRTNHPGYVFNSKLSSREASFNDFGAMDFINSMNNPSGTPDATIIPDNLNNPDPRSNFTTKVTYDIPLFTGFKLSNQKDILKLQHKAQELKYNLNEKELSYEVLKAYNGAVVAKEFITATQKAKEAIELVVKSATAFHNEGLVTKIDVKQAKVHKLNVNSHLIEAQNKFELALAYLRFLTSNDEIKDVKDLKNISNGEYDLERLYKVALKNRDEVKMQDIQKNALKKSIDVANAEYYPNIYTHLEYGFNDDKFTLDSDKDYYMAMLGVNFTLFDANRSVQKEKSKIEYQKATINDEKLKDAIKLELNNAILTLKAKEKILKEKLEAKNLASEVFEQSKLMYKNHLIPMTSLLEQEANLRNNEAQLIVAKYEKSLALAKLKLVLGNKL
jgi:outer membrane protein TolC